MWFRESIKTTSWMNALELCHIAQHGGYGDFRVPNAKEIATLVNDDAPAGSRSLDSTFIAPSSGRLWSSTPSAYPNKAFMLDIEGASISGTVMDEDYHPVLCVRGPD